MARTPFFGRGPAPQIARMDMQAATAPGRNWGEAFASIGQTVGQAVEKHRENKKAKKKERDFIDSFEARISKSPEFAKSLGLNPDDSVEVRLAGKTYFNNPEARQLSEDFSRFQRDAETTRMNAQLEKQRRLQMRASRESMQTTKRDREGRANFLRMMAGPAGTSDEIMDAIERKLEASPPPASSAPAVYDTAEELEAAGIAEMQRQADFKRAEADLGTLEQPLSEASNARFLSRFQGEQDPAVARLALEEFVRRGTPKPGGSIRNLMIGGEEKAVLIDGAGNPVKIVGDVAGQQARVLTPEEEAKVKEEGIELEQAGEFLKKHRTEAYESAKVIIPASRSLRLLEKGGIDTGGLAEFKTDMIVVMNSLGFPLPDEMVEGAANAEEFRAQVGKFLFLNIQQTKGSISEKEMGIFKKISPSLDMSVAANKSLLKYIIARAEREKKKLKYMQELRKKGVPMRERLNLVEDWVMENDLSEMITPIPSGRGGSVNTIQVDLGGGQTAVGQQVGVNAAGERLFKLPDGRVVTENKAATRP
jgi:hypothetical protein